MREMVKRPETGLPALLVNGYGKAVETSAGWEATRRGEVRALLQQYEYGSLPEAALAAQPRLQFGGAPEYLEEHRLWLREGSVSCSVNGSAVSFALLVYTAAQPGMEVQPAPALLSLSAFGSMFWSPRLSQEKFFPAGLIAEAGYVAVHARVDDVTAAGWQDIFFPGGQRGCGEIALWAWAAGLARQCVSLLPEVDAAKIVVSGCSRAGKAALWAAATDEGFAAAATNVSGCGGAAITRGKTGERVADITGQFPLWFAPAYAQYAGREEDMPFDQHFLLALLAPRPLYIASAALDTWADPAAEYAACAAAGEVWGLYGLAGTGAAAMPAENTPLQTGSIWYHCRSGEHGIELYDWRQYLLFMRHFFGGAEQNLR